MALFHATGHVCKKPYPTENANRKLTIPGQLLVMQLVLDNPGIYLHEIQDKLAEFVHSIEEVGALVHFLPPYSPDFNPIEQTFSKVKTVLKSIESDMEDIDDVETLLLASFTSITPEDCESWISHSGIYT